MHPMDTLRPLTDRTDKQTEMFNKVQIFSTQMDKLRQQTFGKNRKTGVNFLKCSNELQISAPNGQTQDETFGQNRQTDEKF